MIVSVPEVSPVVAGVKLMLTVQVPLGRIVALRQLFDRKPAVTAIPVMTRLLVPVLWTVRPSVEVVPTTTVPKAIVVGDRLAVVAPVVRRVDPIIVPEFAVIVEVPAETAVANPAELMVATLVSEEVQVAELVRFPVVPLE